MDSKALNAVYTFRIGAPRTDPGYRGSICAYCTPSSFAARPRSVATWIAVPDAAMRPSRSTPAATGTVRSARPTRATSGWPNAAKNCCQSVHVVFTLPHELSWLALQNKKVVYDLLFRTSAATLLEVAADPKHLGAEIGFPSVLHTWGQNLLHHPHIHCVIPAGGLSLDHQRWIHRRYPFFLPVKVLSRVFRGKFVAGLKLNAT